MIARVVLAVVVLVVAAATYPGALLTSLATRLTPAPAAPHGPPGALPWLHVAHPAGAMPYIADEQGRMVLLHGAIPASLLEFGPGTGPVYPVDPAAYASGQCPENSASSPYPPLCQSDLERMASLGFNSMRLPLSWSLLEPQRGRFSQTYVDRVAQIVDWARSLGIYVIIDMHQNAFSHFVGAGDSSVDLSYDSGAPAWATFTDGFPSHVYAHQREINPAVLEATTNFWYDRGGIQDEYLEALAFLAKRFRDDPVVAGYSLYNEPLPGWNLPPGFEDLLLFPFYRRAIDAITGSHDGLPCWSGFFMPAPCGYRDLADDSRHLIFLDAGLLRQVTDFPTHLGLPISSYPNLVLSIHAYTHVFTLDKLLPQVFSSASYPWGGYDQTYSLGEREARALDAALFIAEFSNAPADDGVLLQTQVAEQERHRLGFAFWPWKENRSQSWGVYAAPSTPTESSGCLRASRERLLARVYPRATADPSLTFHYDASDGSFALHAGGRASDPPTVVYVPREVTGEIAATGAVSIVVSNETDGSRIVYASPTGGVFAIGVAPAPLALAGCG